jgi:hypothetical protein
MQGYLGGHSIQACFIYRTNTFIATVGAIFATVWSGSTGSADNVTRSTVPASTFSFKFRSKNRRARPLGSLNFADSDTYATTMDVDIASNPAFVAMESKNSDVASESAQIPLKVQIQQVRVQE